MKLLEKDITAKFLHFFLILSIFIAGIVVKLEQTQNYKKIYKDFIFTGIDSYYYARITQYLVNDNCRCGRPDFLSFVPDSWVTGFPKLPDYPPIISLITFLMTKLTSKPIEYVSFYLYPMLSLLFLVPFYILFKHYINSKLFFILSTVIVINSPIYYLRTAPGWLDNDVLNLFFPILLSYILLKLYENITLFKIFIFLIINIFYYLWYPKPVLQFIFFATLLIILLLKKNKNKKYLIFVLSLGFIFIVVNTQKLYYLIKYYLLERDSLYGEFPNIYTTISELEKINLHKLVKYLGLNEFIILISLIGFIWLIKVNKLKALIPLFPLIVFSTIPFFIGVKFLIYFLPILSLGLSFFIYRLYVNLKQFFYSPIFFKVINVILTVIIIGYSIIKFKHLSQLTPKPVIPPEIVYEIKKLKKFTPYNAWILSWWDYGEAIKYYTNRATYHDPFNQNFPKTYLIAYTFVRLSNPIQFSNSIKAISYYTNADIVKWLNLRLRREEIINKFTNFKGAPRNKNIYIFFSGDMLYKFSQIYKIANWNKDNFSLDSKNFQVFGFCKLDVNYILKCPEGLIINPYTNKILFRSKEYKVSQIIYRRLNGEIYKFNNNVSQNLIAEIIETKHGIMVFIMSQELVDSPFNKLFILRLYREYSVELIHDNFPFAVLYKFKSDS